MQELLFANQPQWGEQRAPQTAPFIEYARGLGLNLEQFTPVLQGTKYAAKIERDRQDGVALGVRGTPTFFINGRMVGDVSYASLKALIDAELE
jgi:protein-disulfide isomerase